MDANQTLIKVFEGKKYKLALVKGKYRWILSGKITGMLSHAVWTSVNGSIPMGNDIHHVDLDSSNDDIGNLACITHSDHSKLHQAIRKADRVNDVCSICGRIFSIDSISHSSILKRGINPVCGRKCQFERWIRQSGNRSDVINRATEWNKVNRDKRNSRNRKWHAVVIATQRIDRG